MESPVYFQYLNAKLDLLLEYNLILESKNSDAASRIRSHFQSPKFKSVGTDYDTLVQTLDLTKDEAEILSMLSSQFYNATIELKKMFKEHGFHNEYDSNNIFNNIVMSEHNQNILFNNLIKFNDSNASVEKNRARRCRGPWIRCLHNSTVATAIFTAGCIYSVSFGPEAVFGCLGTDSIVANAASTRCYMRWIRCMG